MLSAIEKFFDINLIDEVSFFAPSGKAGELFEIPVLHDDTEMDRLYLVALGEATLKDYRAAGAAPAAKFAARRSTSSHFFQQRRQRSRRMQSQSR